MRSSDEELWQRTQDEEENWIEEDEANVTISTNITPYKSRAKPPVGKTKAKLN